MNHDDHVALLGKGIPHPGGVWADFGSGSGAFTLALADLLGPSATVYSVDRDLSALRHQEQTMRSRFPQVSLHYVHNDYTQAINLPALDGLIMANALHFQSEKQSVVELLRTYLRPGGRFLLVEYDTDSGNRWVPYPIAFPRWKQLAGRCGLANTQLLARRPSRFLGHIYSALSLLPGAEQE